MKNIEYNKNITILENDSYYLDIKEDINITIEKDIKCKIILLQKDTSYNINITLKDNSYLEVNSLNNNTNSNINIELNNNSKIIYNYSLVSNKDSIINYNLKHISDNSYSEINNNGINLNTNKLFFNVDGIINKNLHNINCSQNNKIINYNNGNSKIIPNLIIDSNDIIANHSAYIGNFDKDLVFYMQSRGLTINDINKLLYKSILLGKMNLTDEEELFVRTINDWSNYE